MANDFLSKIKSALGSKTFSSSTEDDERGYVELEPTESIESQKKVIIKPFILTDFGDSKPILDGLREGSTIALVNIRPLKEKDIVELKRAINKLKKTVEAMDGDIAGFGEDWVVVAPSFVEVHRTKGKTAADMDGFDEDN